MIYLWLTLLFAPLLRWRAGQAKSPPRAVLLVQTAKIGDFICTTPLIRELRRGWPEAQLHLLIHGINAPLAQHNPYGARVHLLPPGGLRGGHGRLWLYRLLRQEAIDATLCVSPNLALWLVPLWAGVALRASVLPNFGGGSYRRGRSLLTHGEAHVAGRLLLETEFALLRQLGLRPQSADKEAWPAADAESAADRIVAASGGPLIGLGISSGNKLKALGEDRLVQLAVGLSRGNDARIVLIGGPDDRSLSKSLQARLASTGMAERTIDAVGKLDLSRLPALLGRLDVYVGVDSGITYLADAVGVAVVDLMGPADADDQRPTGPRAVVLRPELPCAPCSHAFHAPYNCRIGTRACVVDFDIEQIAAAARNLLPNRAGTSRPS